MLISSATMRPSGMPVQAETVSAIACDVTHGCTSGSSPWISRESCFGVGEFGAELLGIGRRRGRRCRRRAAAFSSPSAAAALAGFLLPSSLLGAMPGGCRALSCSSRIFATSVFSFSQRSVSAASSASAVAALGGELRDLLGVGGAGLGFALQDAERHAELLDPAAAVLDRRRRRRSG